MSLPRRFRRLCALAGLLAVGTTALAQAWPTKPVNLMVPYPAGGPSDAIARIIAPQLQPLPAASTQEAIEHQPLAAQAQFVLAQQQFLPDRHENVLKHHRQRIAGENLSIQTLEATFVKVLQCSTHLVLPLTPVVTADFVVGRRGDAAAAGDSAPRVGRRSDVRRRPRYGQRR